MLTQIRIGAQVDIHGGGGFHVAKLRTRYATSIAAERHRCCTCGISYDSAQAMVAAHANEPGEHLWATFDGTNLMSTRDS